MGGTTPKVLLKIKGKPIIFWAIESLLKIGIDDIYVVVNFGAEKIKKSVGGEYPEVKFVHHTGVLGTGGSTRAAVDKIELKNTVLVLFGDDSALYKSATLKRFVMAHEKAQNTATFMTISFDKPSAIGGLLIDEDGRVLGVMTKSELEESRCGRHQVACGAFCFDRKWLKENIGLVKKSDSSGEVPLPGLIYVGAEKGEFARTFEISDSNEWGSVNTKDELKEVRRKKKL